MKRPRFHVYSTTYATRGGPPVTEWRWRLIAANGRILASGEGHTRKADAERAVETVKSTIRSFDAGLKRYKIGVKGGKAFHIESIDGHWISAQDLGL